MIKACTIITSKITETIATVITRNSAKATNKTAAVAKPK